jgi:drug/metabolite transporter (DMT)-like permease
MPRAGTSANVISIFSAAALAISLFALTPVTARISAAQLDAIDVGLLRVTVAGLIAAPVLIIFRLRPPQLQLDWMLLTFSAFGTFAAFPVLFVLGTQRTSAAHAALIMAAMPLFTLAIASGLDRRMPTRLCFVGIILALIGEAELVFLRDYSVETQESAAGDLLVLCSCILCASGSATGARVTMNMNSWAATFWSMVLAAIALGPIAFVRLSAVQWAGIPPVALLALLHFTVGAGVFAFVAWFWSLARGGIGRIAVLQFMQPVLGVLFAWALLHDRLTPMIIICGSLIVTGVITAWAGSATIYSAKKVPK